MASLSFLLMINDTDLVVYDDWKIVKRIIDGRTKYLLMQIRHDASAPYFITQRIFRTFLVARKALKKIMKQQS
jgi:hypothetical protein